MYVSIVINEPRTFFGIPYTRTRRIRLDGYMRMSTNGVLQITRDQQYGGGISCPTVAVFAEGAWVSAISRES